MLRRENHQTVITETTAELARNPKNALALRMRAQAYANVEQIPLAFQDRDAIAPLLTNPVTAEEYEALCYAYRSSDKHGKQEAIALCDKAIELNPRAIFAYHGRGVSYRYLFIRNTAENKYYANALSDLNRAMELGPATSRAYLERAKLYGFNEEFKAAIADLTKAIELDGGDNPEAYCIRYSLYVYSGQKRLADADFARLSDSGRCGKFKTRTRLGDTY